MIAARAPTELCRIAARHDTDKGVDFTSVYHSLLSHVREAPLRLLEIGLYNGGSLRMWRDYLPNATLYGIDVDPRTLAYEQEIPGTKVRMVDQADARALRAFVDELGGSYDVILDDGGHTMEQQIVSFEVLFPHVVSGGIYIIEDLGTSYFVEYGGRPIGEDGTAVAHMKRLVDAVQHEHMTPGHESIHSAVSRVALAQVRRDVASMQFHPGQAIIVKA
ncbi:MAG TPA: class I SAM-dependent methyltransferase [Solirubrobacteraceae bacterium]|jgi:predicted O-methyltransferase YrrM